MTTELNEEIGHLTESMLSDFLQVSVMLLFTLSSIARIGPRLF